MIRTQGGVSADNCMLIWHACWDRFFLLAGTLAFLVLHAAHAMRPQVVRAEKHIGSEALDVFWPSLKEKPHKSWSAGALFCGSLAQCFTCPTPPGIKIWGVQAPGGFGHRRVLKHKVTCDPTPINDIYLFDEVSTLKEATCPETSCSHMQFLPETYLRQEKGT